MPRSKSSESQTLQRVPLLRGDCKLDFRRKFGRRMTELEENFLRLGNAALDRAETEIPEQGACARIMENLLQTCDDSRRVIEQAVRTSNESRHLLASARMLLWQVRRRERRTVSRPGDNRRERTTSEPVVD